MHGCALPLSQPCMLGFINWVLFAAADHFNVYVFLFAFTESFPAESSCFAYSENSEIGCS